MELKPILEMNREDLLNLDPHYVIQRLKPEEAIHIATTLGGFWTYNYEAAENGIAGLHAELKSGLHSDGFLVSRIFLAPQNIRLLFATQIAMVLQDSRMQIPDYIAGIPTGATELGELVRGIIQARSAVLEKVDGRIVLKTPINPKSTVALVEDFITRGTGFRETVRDIKEKCPDVNIAPYVLAIINRGGLEVIEVDGIGTFKILPIANKRINDWKPEDCPLCHKYGSRPIKPKATEENWRAITTSQLTTPIT
jgi:orotate phosphoribosyltransferase